jgi:hypothetical protein
MNEAFNKALKGLEQQLKQTKSVKKLFDNIDYLKHDGLENLTDEFYSQTLKTAPRNFKNKDGRNKNDEYFALLSLAEQNQLLFKDIPYGVFLMDDKTPILIIGQIIRVKGSAEFMKNDSVFCLGAIMFNSSDYSQNFYIEHYGREVIVGNNDVLVRPPTFLNKEEISYGRWREYGYRKDIKRKKLLKSKLEEIFAYREMYLEGLKNEADEVQVKTIEKSVRRYCERINKKAKDWKYELVSLKTSRLSGDFSGTLKLEEMEDELYDLESDLSEEEINTNPRVNNLKQKIEEYEKERKVFGNTLCKVTNNSDEYGYDDDTHFVIYFAINSKRDIMLMQFTPKTFESTEKFNEDIISKL